MSHPHGDKIRTRWDKRPEDYPPREDAKSEKKLLTGEVQEHKHGDDREHYKGVHNYDGSNHHHRPAYDRHGKENGRGHSNTDKPKRVTGYMRGWDDEQDEASKWKHHDRYKENFADQDYGKHSRSDGKYREIQTKECMGDDVERRQPDRETRFKHADSSKYSARSDFSAGRFLFDQRANDMVRFHTVNGLVFDRQRFARFIRFPYSLCVLRAGRLPGEKGVYRSHDHNDKEDGKRGHDEHHHKGVGHVERGRRRERSPTFTSMRSSRDEDESSSSTESGSSRSHSSDDSESWRRSRRASERSSHRVSKRKDRGTRSRSASRSSCDERERKRKKKEKEKRKKDKSRKKDKDREERRSVLTGKKIKLRVKKDKDDHERDANRQELLQFLNAAYE
ncbi:hypothetical protein APHAL10511_000361 [Amanita phalloides]|nr:hypothetical protein APHAL10511_000361 [Amanita phalloides]